MGGIRPYKHPSKHTHTHTNKHPTMSKAAKSHRPGTRWWPPAPLGRAHNPLSVPPRPQHMKSPFEPTQAERLCVFVGEWYFMSGCKISPPHTHTHRGDPSGSDVTRITFGGQKQLKLMCMKWFRQRSEGHGIHTNMKNKPREYRESSCTMYNVHKSLYWKVALILAGVHHLWSASYSTTALHRGEDSC